MLIAEYAAFAQRQVFRGGSPARRSRYSAAGSIRYGYSGATGTRSRLLPSEERYLRSARGLLPSQERYRRYSDGMLPSAGRYGYVTSGIHRQKSLAMQVQSNIHRGMGTIRYGGTPVPTYVPVQPRLSVAVTVKPRPYALAITPKAYTPSSRAYSAQGSIRYGVAQPFWAKSLPQGKSFSPARKKKAFSYAPEDVLADKSAASLNIQALAYSSGSIRYGKTATFMPMGSPKPSIFKSKATSGKKQTKDKASKIDSYKKSSKN